MEKDEFNKKISDISNTFSLARTKIGAKDVGFKLIPRELKTPTGKFNSGKPITGVELQKISENWKSKEPLIDEDGNAFVLYIPDFSSNHYRRNISDPENLPKYHVSWCWTLEHMTEVGRMKRYIKKTDIENNLFKGKGDNDVSLGKILNTCKNCRKNMQDIYGINMYFDIVDMDMLKFFEKYGKQNLNDTEINTSYSIMYPKHWDKISKEYRENANWICEKCNTSFGDNRQSLHVHHIDGVKSNIIGTNLKVLCKECHAEQFGHGRMKNLL